MVFFCFLAIETVCPKISIHLGEICFAVVGARHVQLLKRDSTCNIGKQSSLPKVLTRICSVLQAYEKITKKRQRCRSFMIFICYNDISVIWRGCLYANFVTVIMNDILKYLRFFAITLFISVVDRQTIATTG